MFDTSIATGDYHRDMSDLLQQIGLTKEEIQERVIDRIVAQLNETHGCDDEGNETGPWSSAFKTDLDKRMTKAIDVAIGNLFKAHVEPGVEKMVSDIVFQETNRWGEKTGNPVTFIELLVQRCDNYMREQVDHSGKSRSEANDSYWKGYTTRVVHLIDQYLKYNIQTAMEQALKEANSSIAKGLEEGVKVSLKNIMNGIKCSVTV